jgi:hypothetical protein
MSHGAFSNRSKTRIKLSRHDALWLVDDADPDIGYGIIKRERNRCRVKDDEFLIVVVLIQPKRDGTLNETESSVGATNTGYLHGKLCNRVARLCQDYSNALTDFVHEFVAANISPLLEIRRQSFDFQCHGRFDKP